MLASDDVKPIIINSLRIIKQYDSDKQKRLALKVLQPENNRKELIKPNSTRWSSHFYACERLLLLKQFINKVTPQESTFWVNLNLKYVCDFLEPFRVATDIIQQDCALLIDVYIQFTNLMTACKNLKEHEFLSGISGEANKTIKKYWHNMVNKHSVIACAILALEDTSMFPGVDVLLAQDFISEFGTNYMMAYNLQGKHTAETMNATLTAQVSDLNGRTGAFQGCEQRMAKLKSHYKDATKVVCNV